MADAPSSSAPVIDVTFDFRTDSAGGDPDRTSPTLRRYHQLLWSKPLPSGRSFELDTTTPWVYLHHHSEAGEFELSSDSVIATFTGWISTVELMAQLDPGQVEEFEVLSYTIGGMMVFPSNRVDGQPTINMARGMHRTTIGDRMDLTLECIRRMYAGDLGNPLGPTLARYPEFFALFGGFAAYVEFFLLRDLVTADGSRVRFFTPFDDFAPTAVPSNRSAYAAFRERSMEFVVARNARIQAWASSNL